MSYQLNLNPLGLNLLNKSSSGYRTPKSEFNISVACPDELPDFHDRQAAQVEWKALAPLISHSPVVRVSRDGGKTYPHKWVRELQPDSLPLMPAAVHLHDKHGCGHVLVLDLDQAAGNVDDDYTALTKTLDDTGALWFADASPSGGRHIYIPLNDDVPHTVLADVARRLATRHPSVDPNPHYSADTGCIRPPGSVWKRGGHQRLITDLKEAIAAATLRNPTSMIDALLAGIPASPPPSAENDVDVDVSAYVPDTQHQVSPRIARIARTGMYDTTRYASDSEARQAVVTACVRAGLTQVEVIRRIETGIWPGLASKYARYRQRRTALLRDWKKARTWLSTHGKSSVQSGTTSPQVTGGVPHPATKLPLAHEELRRLEHHLAHTEPAPDSAAARRRYFLLRALLAAAHQDRSLTIARGCRNLALTSGIDRTKIPAVLDSLCAEPRPLIRKVTDAHGKQAAAYTLLPPDAATPDRSPWKIGQPVQILRPAFRVLGLTAAAVYEALELHGANSGRGVAAITGLSPTTVLEALGLLYTHGLTKTSHHGGNTFWSVTTSQDLVDAAERLGATAIVAALILRYRTERLAWWAWLAERALLAQIQSAAHQAVGPGLWPPGCE
ncbi:hypothetical protein QFE97_19020 (plasmid) [Bacillus subtilis]|nr:hypothetical protein QFE97_19020 [Bacillus subtilis]